MTTDSKENCGNVTFGDDEKYEDTRIDPNASLPERASHGSVSIPTPTPKEQKEFDKGFDEAIVKGIEKERDIERKIVPETDKQVDRRKSRLEALEFQLEEAKLQTNKKANVRKSVALEIAKWVQKNYKKDLTRREAAAVINEELKSKRLETYSEKHLIMIIRPLDFHPGKAGRRPKK